VDVKNNNQNLLNTNNHGRMAVKLNLNGKTMAKKKNVSKEELIIDDSIIYDEVEPTADTSKTTETPEEYNGMNVTAIKHFIQGYKQHGWDDHRIAARLGVPTSVITKLK
jgi:hypothetical protein